MQIERMELDAEIAAKFARWALKCINQEYPRNGVFWFKRDADVKLRRELTPAFYGCLDWHSAVHAH